MVSLFRSGRMPHRMPNQKSRMWARPVEAMGIYGVEKVSQQNEVYRKGWDNPPILAPKRGGWVDNSLAVRVPNHIISEVIATTLEGRNWKLRMELGGMVKWLLIWKVMYDKYIYIYVFTIFYLYIYVYIYIYVYQHLHATELAMYNPV